MGGILTQFGFGGSIDATPLRYRMFEQILIVATEPVAKAPAEVATSLSFTPVVTASEQEALDLLNRHNFTLIAVSGRPAWQRLRAEAERTQPAARVVELPENGSDDAD